MRINIHGHSIEKYTKTNITELESTKPVKVEEQVQSIIKYEIGVPEAKLKKAVDTINKFFEDNNKKLKFVYHEGLEEYYVQLINSNTEEVVKEIPSKKLLDVYYEIQKLAGVIIDEKK